MAGIRLPSQKIGKHSFCGRYRVQPAHFLPFSVSGFPRLVQKWDCKYNSDRNYKNIGSAVLISEDNIEIDQEGSGGWNLDDIFNGHHLSFCRFGRTHNFVFGYLHNSPLGHQPWRCEHRSCIFPHCRHQALSYSSEYKGSINSLHKFSQKAAILGSNKSYNLRIILRTLHLRLVARHGWNQSNTKLDHY